MVGGVLNCTPGKRGIFFFREFFSRALISERLGHLRKNQGWKRQLKRKKKTIRNRSDEGLAQETSACVSPFHCESTL